MAVVRLQEQAKKRMDEVISPAGDEELRAQQKSHASERLDQLTAVWNQLKASTRNKQSELEEALKEVFDCLVYQRSCYHCTLSVSHFHHLCVICHRILNHVYSEECHDVTIRS